VAGFLGRPGRIEQSILGNPSRKRIGLGIQRYGVF